MPSVTTADFSLPPRRYLTVTRSPGLLSAIEDKNLAVQFHAVTAAGRIFGGTTAEGTGSLPPKDVIDRLLQRLGRERDFFTHYAVFTALNRIGRGNKDLWRPILEGLKSGNADVRAGTVYALRDAYDPAVTSRLLALVKDDKLTPETRAARNR